MSKSTTEREIDQTIDFLKEIERAHRLNNDEKLKQLGRDAGKFAETLKHARDQMHSHWDEA